MFLVGTEFYWHEGGIQQVNRSLMGALSSERLEIPTGLKVFSFLDRVEDLPLAVRATADFSGHGGWRSALLAKLTHAVLRVQPDLILFTHVSLLPLTVMCRMLSPRTRIAVLCHGVEVWEPLPLLLRRNLQTVDAVVCPSEFTKARVALLQWIPRERIQVITHGLAPGWQMLPMGGQPSKDGHRLLTVCRMSRSDNRHGTKGIDALLEAMARLKMKTPGVHLDIAGDGDDRSRLEEKSRTLGLQKEVCFLGRIGDAQLQEHYRRADIFVLPSSVEGFGVVFIEAMAHGLPVIASKAAAAPEVVIDQQTGILVPDSAPDTLAAAISSLVSDAVRRRELALAAKRRVETHFLFEHFSARWRDWLVGMLPRQAYLARHTLYFPPAVPAMGLTNNRTAA